MKKKVVYLNGIRYIKSGGFLVLDQIIDPIDRLHNYCGRQAERKPYNRVSAQASLLR